MKSPELNKEAEIIASEITNDMLDAVKPIFDKIAKQTARRDTAYNKRLEYRRNLSRIMKEANQALFEYSKSFNDAIIFDEASEITKEQLGDLTAPEIESGKSVVLELVREDFLSKEVKGKINTESETKPKNKLLDLFKKGK